MYVKGIYHILCFILDKQCNIDTFFIFELISIGSLGKGNFFEEVEEVHVQNCSFTGSTNGARIKTFPVSN